MAIQIYNWNNTSGKCTIEQKGRQFDLNVYAFGTSNCFFATVYEYENPEDHKTYEQLQWFFVDDLHAKKMLGLAKTRDGKMENVLADELKSLTLYKSTCRDWYKLRNLFRKAFGKDFPITILEERDAE